MTYWLDHDRTSVLDQVQPEALDLNTIQVQLKELKVSFPLHYRSVCSSMLINKLYKNQPVNSKKIIIDGKSTKAFSQNRNRKPLKKNNFVGLKICFKGCPQLRHDSIAIATQGSEKYLNQFHKLTHWSNWYLIRSNYLCPAFLSNWQNCGNSLTYNLSKTSRQRMGLHHNFQSKLWQFCND